jgi:hypothetical protein
MNIYNGKGNSPAFCAGEFLTFNIYKNQGGYTTGKIISIQYNVKCRALG